MQIDDEFVPESAGALAEEAEVQPPREECEAPDDEDLEEGGRIVRSLVGARALRSPYREVDGQHRGRDQDLHPYGRHGLREPTLSQPPPDPVGQLPFRIPVAGIAAQ